MKTETEKCKNHRINALYFMSIGNISIKMI